MQPTIVVAQTEAEFHQFLSTRGWDVYVNSVDTYILRPLETHILIDQMRDLTEFIKTSGSIHTLIVYQFDTASEIAQHSLLKMIEEKHEKIRMIFWVHSADSLLPTVLSRCVVSRAHFQSHPDENGIYREFISQISTCSVAQLFSNPLIQDMTKEKAETFLHGLLYQLQVQLVTTPNASRCIQIIFESLQLLTQVNAQPQLIVDTCILRCKHGINNV